MDQENLAPGAPGLVSETGKSNGCDPAPMGGKPVATPIAAEVRFVNDWPIKAAAISVVTVRLSPKRALLF